MDDFFNAQDYKREINERIQEERMPSSVERGPTAEAVGKRAGKDTAAIFYPCSEAQH